MPLPKIASLGAFATHAATIRPSSAARRSQRLDAAAALLASRRRTWSQRSAGLAGAALAARRRLGSSRSSRSGTSRLRLGAMTLAVNHTTPSRVTAAGEPSSAPHSCAATANASRAQLQPVELVDVRAGPDARILPDTRRRRRICRDADMGSENIGGR